jgi:hypothetical protein
MTPRDADPTLLVGPDTLSTARSLGAPELPARPAEEDLEELLSYTPVPPRSSRTLVVRFRRGARLKPLPYSVDEENP